MAFTAPPGGFSFAAPASSATSQPGQTSSTPLFGAPTSGTNLFGAAPASAASKPAEAPTFNFGTPSAQSSSTNAFSGFSLPTASTATSTPQAPPPTTGFNFGGFGTSKPAAVPAQSVSAPVTPSLAPATFSFAPVSQAPAPSAAPAKAPGFSFGPAPTSLASTSSVPAASSPAPTLSPFPAFNAPNATKKPSPLGANSPVFPVSPALGSSTTPSTGSAASSVPAASNGSAAPTLRSFGQTAGATPSLSFGSASTAQPTPASSAATSLPSFGLSIPAASSASPAPGSLVTAAPLGGAVQPAGAVQPTAPAPSLQPSVLSGMRLDEIVNRWSDELEERIKEFMSLAAEVKAWDAILIANGDQISDLYTQLQQTEPTQQKIVSSLDYVETQQKELSTILDSYEKQVADLLGPSDMQGHLVGADAERERAYRLAESLNTQLDEMSRSLTSLIQDVNALSHSTGLTVSSSQEGASDRIADPVAQIAAILNAHLAGLQWIETMSDQLKRQMDDMEAKVKTVSNGTWSGLKSKAASSPARKNTPQRSLYGYGR